MSSPSQVRRGSSLAAGSPTGRRRRATKQDPIQTPAVRLLQIAQEAEVPVDWLLVVDGSVVRADKLVESLISTPMESDEPEDEDEEPEEVYRTVEQIYQILVSLGMDYDQAAVVAITYSADFLDFEADARDQLADMAALITTKVPEMDSPQAVVDYVTARRRDQATTVAYEGTRLQAFLNAGAELEATEDGYEILSTGFRRENVSRGSKATWVDHELVEADLVEIFDKIEATSLCPYVAYFDVRGNPIRKLYTKRDIHLDRIVKPIMALKKSQIHLRLWAGKVGDSRLLTAGTNASDLYADVVIDGITGEVVVSLDLKDKASVLGYKVVIQRFQELLPGMALSGDYVKSVEGRYTIWGMDYNREMWMHFLLTDEVAREYMFVNETQAPAAYRLRHTTHYQDLGDRLFTDKLVFFGDDPKRSRLVTSARNGRLSCRLVPRLAPEDVEITDDKEGDTREAVADTPYMEIMVTDADNDEIVARFQHVLDRLVHRYHAKLDDIRDLYRKIDEKLLTIQGRRDLEGLKPETDFLGVNTPVKTETLTKRERLRMLNPDLFGDEYERLCPSRSMPRVIGDTGEGGRGRTRIDAKILDTGRRDFNISANRQESFYCPSTNDPFMGEVETAHGAAPCCYSRDPAKVDQKTRRTAGTKGRVLATIKIANVDTQGTLPPAIEQLLNGATGEINRRLGIILDDDSMAHAVLRATEKEYRAGNAAKRTEMARQVRLDLTEYLRAGPQVCSQELLGMDMDAVIAGLEAGDALDSRLFYRYFEERFGINLYVFMTPLIDNGRERGTFLIPRSVGRHLRNHRVAPGVALLFNRGSGKAATSRSGWAGGHHELIVTIQGKTPFGLYTIKQSQKIYDSLLAVNGQDLWLRDPAGRLQGYRNPGSLLNLEKVLDKAKAQVVDAHGHAVKSVYTIEEKTLIIETIPTAPDGSPLISESELPEITVGGADLLKIFGKPRSVATDSEGRVIGCWYSALGITDLIEIKCLPTSTPFQLRNPIVRRQILSEVKSNSVQGLVGKYHTVKRDVNMIVELVKWVYDVYRLIDGNGVVFFRDYFMKVSDSQTKAGDMPYYFGEPDEPIVSVHSLLRYLSRSTPIIEHSTYQDEEDGTEVERYQIVIGDQVFFDRIVSMLEDHQKMPATGLHVFAKRHLESKYGNYRDFAQHENTQLVLGKNNFDRRVNVETRGRAPIPIRLMSTDMAFASNPFIYQSGNQYYYVVNLGLSYKPEAWNVYYQWMLSQILVELSSTPVETPPYAMYRIGDTYQLEAYEDHSDGRRNHCRVLSYDTTLGHYAVLLPIGDVIEQV